VEVARTVFWSWQSDRPGKVNRHFLREVVARAIEHAAGEMELEERIEIDHDVQGTAGIVAITDTIMAKIDAADVFVADLTPVATTADGKHVANPNVLIELGYAKKALGPERIVLVWNGAWGGCQPEDLPFDLRHRRAPFRYVLSPDQTGAEREVVARQLVPELGEAIKASLGTVPPEADVEIARIQSWEDDPSIWFRPGGEMTVASGHLGGPERIVVRPSARCYIRVAPAKWGSGRLVGVKDDRAEIMPLGDTMTRSWGRIRGGVITYETDERLDGQTLVSNGTQWFSSNGEIWGFDGRISFGIDQSHAGLAVDYIVQCWMRFLLRHARTFADYGASGPYVVEAGVTGFNELYWPRDEYGVSCDPAIEETIVFTERLAALDRQAARKFVRSAADELRHAYGRGPFSDNEMLQLLSDHRASP
jgi:hypothetical protein